MDRTPLQHHYGSGRIRNAHDWRVYRFGSLVVLGVSGSEYGNDAGQSWPKSEQPGSMLRHELGVMRFSDLMLHLMGETPGRMLLKGEIDSHPEVAAVRDAYRDAVRDALSWCREWPFCLTESERDLILRRVQGFSRAYEARASCYAAEQVSCAVGMLHPLDFQKYAHENDLANTVWGKRALAVTRDFLVAMEGGKRAPAEVPQAPNEGRQPAGARRSPEPARPRTGSGHGAAVRGDSGKEVPF